jgi:L-lactate dehydrogenase complex protein LldF
MIMDSAPGNSGISDFPARAAAALADPTLQGALAKLQTEFRRDRAAMLGRMPEFDELRDHATTIRNHSLAHLDELLEQFEKNVTAAGGIVHWCRNAAEACETVTEICRTAGARTVAKSKSMLSEEIALNNHLAAAGIEPVETDLGEYILQLRHETPSHIVMPAIHLNAGQIADVFRDAHTDRDPERNLGDADALLAEARAMLRQKFLDADVGITGANALIAETGSILLVTNEGNADLVHSLPKTHIAIVGIEKAVATLDDAMAVVRVLARSATTQEITSYTTLVTGKRRANDAAVDAAMDADGPESFHVVLVDNGRSRMLAGPYAEALRCIRCGACQSLCPVYGAVGGHAYGAVYAGPIGAVLTPNLGPPDGLAAARHLPQASSFCGQCEDVCPVRIPLPALMRRLREDAFEDRRITVAGRKWIGVWGWAAQRPALYRLAQRIGISMLRIFARVSGGTIRTLPLAGGWSATRDFPPPEGGSFVDLWNRRKRREPS